METKSKRKYVKKDYVEASVRMAKCGHVSKQGRYRMCENCLPVLPEDNGDWDYFNLGSDELEDLE